MTKKSNHMNISLNLELKKQIKKYAIDNNTTVSKIIQNNFIELLKDKSDS